MKQGIALLYLLLLSTCLYAQRSVIGRVLIASNSQPIPGASVFITNSTLGTVSDRNGNFELPNIPDGQFELIISSVGFETVVYPFNSTSLPLKLKVEMEEKVREMENVVVEPYEEDKWKKWGKVFSDNFLGTTPNGLACKIKNTGDIRFRYYKKSNRLVAFSDKPLRIENKNLGYDLSFQLEEFEVDFAEKASFFAGYTLFTSMGKEDNPKEKWLKQREKAYRGSVMHFMRSLYKDSLDKEGFTVIRMQRTPNQEKERVRKIYRDKSFANNVNTVKRSSGIITVGSEADDSMAYYRRVMRQNDFIDTYGRDKLSLDSLVIHSEGSSRVLFWPDYLLIMFADKPEKEYLERFWNTVPAANQQSPVFLRTGEPITLTKNGEYAPLLSFMTMGYWSWKEKVGDMLPIDYVP